MVRVLERGATLGADGSVEFSVWAPLAATVEVQLWRGRWQEAHALAPSPGGLHRGAVRDIPAGTDYVYRVDGRRELPDPVSRWRPQGVHGPSRVVDPHAFAWSDGAWRGLALPQLAIYELHVGTFTPAGTFDSAIDRLPYLRELGVSAVEIMPVAEFPGRRNWGYDGVSLYAPQSTYGGPSGLKRLVDAAHGEGLAVLLDVVYNHLGPEGNYLHDFGPYFSDRFRTLWGEGFNLDGPGSDEVRRYLVDNAVYWTTEYHIDGLRLDAADRIIDLSALHILEELAGAVHRQGEALERRALVIGEIDANDPRYVRPPELGGYGLDAQWADDFHHAVHTALTGEQAGYYRDFGGIAAVGKALSERFVIDGRYSAHRQRRHGRPARDVPADRFVVCIQNHDQVGNRAGGERLAALVEPEAVRLAAAILLLSPYVPLLFMGEEYGEVNPFLYFVSHGDSALVEAVREGRRREFAGFEWTGELPDPQAEATFEVSRLDWALADSPPHAGIRLLYRDLLRLRRTEPALRPGSADASVHVDEAHGWISLDLKAPSSALRGVFNFASAPCRVALDDGKPAALIFSSDAATYGGRDGAEISAHELLLPPLCAVLLRAHPA
ncbi:MAG: malto-oligosyltrehalose trehalohydrolase [Gemmatimonadales bacterium]|nr:malto-oligosyltrehalose trehalohydrolase [Gemmatimonadales bacterium]